jgi:hypothetical protein
MNRNRKKCVACSEVVETPNEYNDKKKAILPEEWAARITEIMFPLHHGFEQC